MSWLMKIDYAVWLNGILTSRGMKTDHLFDNFRRIEQAVQGRLAPSLEQSYVHMLRKAMTALEGQKSN